MNNGNGKPKLELQVNIPTKIKLLQEKPATGESQYGKWWLYSVMADGIEYSLFTPEQVQKYIEEHGLKKNDELQITNTNTKSGKSNIVDFQIELVNKAESHTNTNTTATNGSNDIKIMRECLIAAIELQKELGSVVDVNRVGLSLYISKTKNGY